MIEVFKTNIAKKREARTIVNHLLKILPTAAVSMDLEDCDRILRIESNLQYFDIDHVMALITKMGFECQALSD